jgi:pimeloyl-ACP methyl ester carboxylesterase
VLKCYQFASVVGIKVDEAMGNFRVYGNAPYNVAVIHGGPGAIGEMEPLALELAPDFGVLEPFQSALSLEGQIAELRDLLVQHASLPVILIGFSWGAWLSYLVTAKHPELVKKLILVGSGPFETSYVANIQETRLSRLTGDEKVEYNAIIQLLGDPHGEGKAESFARLGQLAAKTDRFDPLDIRASTIEGQALPRGNQFHTVLQEAQELRQSGALLTLAAHIRCPVVALHGDYDPHPAAGVREPLSVHIRDFRFILLENCGHKPWIERQAQDKFYELLRVELGLDDH